MHYVFVSLPYHDLVSKAYDVIAPVGPTVDASSGGPYTVGVTSTTYMGMPAYRILTSAKQLVIPAGKSLPQQIDYQENGVLTGFTIAVNDPLFQVNCILYGAENSQTTLNDITMQQVSALGRGLTQGQAESVGPQGQSLDQQAVQHQIWPYIQRYRHTYSLQAILANFTYQQVVGTLDDKWIVLDYAPTNKEGYTRLFIDVVNLSNNDRLIHLLQINRIQFKNTSTTQYKTGSANLAESYHAQRLSFQEPI